MVDLSRQPADMVPFTGIDAAGNEVHGSMLACECGSITFNVCYLRNVDHPHYKCTECGVSYCRTGCPEFGEQLAEQLATTPHPGYPHTIFEVINYLKENPKVLCRWPGREPIEETFLRGDPDTGIWFRRESGEHSFLPLGSSCSAEHPTQLEFSEKGFTVVKFGLRLEFEYAD